MTITDAAGAHLANAVELYLRGNRYTQDGPYAVLSDALAYYRQAQREHVAALAANDLQDNDQ